MAGPDEEREDRAAISLLSGPPPGIEGYADADAETAVLRAWVDELAEAGVRPGEIAILARTRQVLQTRAVPALEASALPFEFLSGETPPKEDTLSLGTLHFAKGLEYRAVAVIGCEAGLLPHPRTLAVADDA